MAENDEPRGSGSAPDGEARRPQVAGTDPVREASAPGLHPRKRRRGAADDAGLANKALRALIAQQERKRLIKEMDEQARLREAVFENAPVGIAVFDGRGLRVKYANKAYAMFLDEPYRGRALVGLRLQEYLPAAEESGVAEICRRVAATGKPFFVEEYEFAGLGRGVTYWRWAALPLPAETPAGRDLLLLMTEVTGQVAARKKMEEMAAEAGRRADEARERSAETAALLAAARAILEHHDFEHAARGIFDACKGLLGATAGYVALLSEDGSENEVLFLDPGGRRCTVDPSLPMPIRGLRAEAYRTGRAVHDNDFARSRHAEFLPPGHAVLENVLFAPLAVRGRVVGLMGLANKCGGFSDRDVRMATAFAELAAVALLNGRAADEIRKARDQMNIEVRMRTAELEDANIALQDEVVLRQQAEQLARAEHERLYSVLGMIPGFVMLARQDHSIAFANVRFVEAFGDPAGRSCYAALHGRDEPCDVCQASEVLRSGVPREWEWTGGDGRSYHVWGYPFGGADGEQFALEVGIDITGRKELEREILEISDQAQQRIGRDLHDVLGQSLTGLSFMVQSLAQRLSERETPEAGQAREIAGLVKTALTQARTISHGLSTLEMTGEGLGAALGRLGEGTEKIFGIHCTLECREPIPIFNGTVATNLYHIAQEAVNNAAKHARPRNVRIRLARADGGIVLSVEDDGVGLPKVCPAGKGMGLRIMHHRASLVGASLRVEPRDGGGTRVVCRVPEAAL